MTDYKVGYGKPPLHSRFKLGVCANPKGRPKRAMQSAAQIVEDTMNAEVEYREHGSQKTAPRWQLSIVAQLNKALSGDVAAAEMLLELRIQAERRDAARVQRISVRDWLPDYEGQTAEQKTQDNLNQSDATSSGWWEQNTDSSQDQPPNALKDI